MFQVDYIVESRKKGRTTEYKVRWKNFGDEEDTWLSERDLQKTAPLVVQKFKTKGLKQVRSLLCCFIVAFIYRNSFSLFFFQQSSKESTQSRSSKTSSSNVITTTKETVHRKLESFVSIRPLHTQYPSPTHSQDWE